MKENRIRKIITRKEGITLIALIITVIVLLILATVILNLAYGENGIFKITNKAKILTKISEIEEQARLSYIGQKTEEIVGGEEATIERVIEDLEYQKYVIKKIVSDENFVVGITLNNNKIIMGKNTSETMEYKLNYSKGKVRYFVEIYNKYFEITLKNDEIEINTEESNLEKLQNPPIITVSSSDDNIATVELLEDNNIILKSGNVSGNAIIIVREKNSNVTATCEVSIEVKAMGLTISEKDKTVILGEEVKLQTTVTPTDTTEKIIWDSSDPSVAKVLEDGTVVGLKIGSANITATCGNFSDFCSVNVVTYSSTITASEYGKEVINYIEGQSWQIFFADEDNIYLIKKDKVVDPVYGTKANLQSVFNSGQYNSGMTLLRNEVSSKRFPAANKWLGMYKKYMDSNNLNNTRENFQATLFMLDSENIWMPNYGNEYYAEYVVGGPTAEMMVYSLNSAGRSGLSLTMIGGGLGYNKSGSCSSYFGVSPWCPYTDAGCYWIASPTDVGNGLYGMVQRYRNGDWTYVSLKGSDNTNYNHGYRPVVCLKSEVSLVADSYNSNGSIKTYRIEL